MGDTLTTMLRGSSFVWTNSPKPERGVHRHEQYGDTGTESFSYLVDAANAILTLHHLTVST